eukprot:521740-Prymnesium_polylepis.2
MSRAIVPGARADVQTCGLSRHAVWSPRTHTPPRPQTSSPGTARLATPPRAACHPRRLARVRRCAQKASSTLMLFLADVSKNLIPC